MYQSPSAVASTLSGEATAGGNSIVGVSISKGVGADVPITVKLVTKTAAGTNVSW